MISNPLQHKFNAWRTAGKGLLATNFYNFETLMGVLRAAESLDTPLILQLTKSSIDYMGLPVAVNMARTAIAETGVEAWLHLDHGDSLELLARCLDAGFESVMIDASEEAFEKNIEITAQAVRLAEPYGANVEAELGYVAKLGQSTEFKGFTQPAEAKTFVEATGVHAVAVAIGSAHGFYKAPPKLQMDLLSTIQKAIPDTALVLHGSSGIPTADLQEAIRRGIVKINLATEIKNIFMQTLKQMLAQTKEIDLRKVFPAATAEVTKLVAEKLRAVNMERMVFSGI